jgi:hypothetical protein
MRRAQKRMPFNRPPRSARPPADEVTVPPDQCSMKPGEPSITTALPPGAGLLSVVLLFQFGRGPGRTLSCRCSTPPAADDPPPTPFL